jgi:AraC-like DNA-binding protein
MQVFDTGGASGDEAFGRYQDVMACAQLGMEIRADDPAQFWARVRTIQLGDVTLMSVQTRSSGLDVARTSSWIRRSDPEAYRILLGVDGRSGFQHCGRSAVQGPDQMALYDSSQPFTGRRIPGADGRQHIIMATFPRRALPLDPRYLLGECLPVDDGVSALVRDFLTRLGGDTHDWRSRSGHRLADVWLDLLTVHLGDLLDPVPARDAADRTLFLRVQEFIDTHLADPCLTLDAVAAAHFISPRTLQRLFARHDTTVAAWIRTRRLARCREDLRNPAQAHRSVRAIAARWGFTDQAQFSRAFRHHYGATPSACRAETGTDASCTTHDAQSQISRPPMPEP